MATQHKAFVWHAQKAAQNLAKHGVTFEDAARVLADPLAEMFHLENFDDEHSDENEDRWITIGSEPAARDVVLFVVWAPQQDATRIISARTVTRHERREYEAEFRRHRHG